MKEPRASLAAETDRQPNTIGLIELFLMFSRLGLTSFGGGVSAWMHRAFVERQLLISETEFAATLALGRIMPGANVVNLSILIGQRLRGFCGALVAMLGILVGPSLVVIALAALYHQFGEAASVEAVLEGTAAAAVGLSIAMGLQTGLRIVSNDRASGRQAIQSIGTTVVLVVVFLFIGVLRLPMILTVVCLAPLSIALAFFGARGEKADGDG
jgi:chromate transporter